MGEVSSVQVVNSPECQADGNREPQNEWFRPGRAILCHGGRPAIRPGLGQDHRDGEQGADRRALERDGWVVQWKVTRRDFEKHNI